MHGVIRDFIDKLKRELEILGDGSQRKSYLYVDDAVDASLHAFKAFLKSNKPYEVFNVGSEDQVGVTEMADVVVEEMGLENVEYRFKPATPDGRGWLGDVKDTLLDINKLKSLGWIVKVWFQYVLCS